MAVQKEDSQMATNSLTALITGGTSGIGRATAKKLAKLGIHVLVVGRNAKRGDETLAEIRTAGGRVDFISSDLRNASSAREVAKRALELGNGHINFLINNAGIFPFGPTDQTTEEEFDRVYSLKRQGAIFPGRETCSVDGEERKRGHRQCFDDGCRLRSVRHEPLWLQQGRD
jgi:NAD(P)-dependent dehydrogenase (short-subunit alcohol dehydrogenase family)